MAATYVPDRLPQLPQPSILTIDQVERAHVFAVCAQFEWNLSSASHALGIDRRTLYRKLERWGTSGKAERRNLLVAGREALAHGEHQAGAEP